MGRHHRLGGRPGRAVHRRGRVRRRVRQRLHGVGQRLLDRPGAVLDGHLPAAGRVPRADRLPRPPGHGRRPAVGGRPVRHQRLKLPDVIKAVSPFASSEYGAVSKDGTIAYASVRWSVNPDSLDASYLDSEQHGRGTGREGGPVGRVRRGHGGDRPDHRHQSEIRRARLALVLLLIMFGRWFAAIPLVAHDLQRCCTGSRCWRCCEGGHVPDHAPTIATLRARRRRGLRAVHRRPGGAWLREWVSWPRAAHRGEPRGHHRRGGQHSRPVSVLALYVSGLGFVGALGLARRWSWWSR